MKTIIKGVLGTIGLAPARQVERLTVEARDADARIGTLEQRQTKLRADAESWKQRHDTLARSMAELKERASRAEQEAERARNHSERADAKADESRKRAETLQAQLRDLHGRLIDAERVTTTVREHLMATETKLDLVEAALQVLDTRTREGAVSRL
jgi:chromosome segregation ATPase